MKRERITLCAIAVGSLCMPAMAQSICNGGTDCPDVLITPISATGSFKDLSDPDNLEILVGHSFLVEISLDGTSFPAADVCAVQLQLDIIGGAGLNCDDFTVDRTRGDFVIGYCTACAAVCGPPHVAGLFTQGSRTVDFLAYIAEMTLTCKAAGSFTLEFGGTRLNSVIYSRGSTDGVINITHDPTHFESINVECVTSPCGNGVLDSGFGEACDDGNTASGDGCDANCVIEFCGDGILNDSPNEECDDGNNDRLDGCDPFCKENFCGDGIRNNGPPGGPGEDCDDGGTVGGDGCSATCQFEGAVPTVSGWSMAALVTLLLIGITVKFRGRSRWRVV